jgi:hypothetical protein
VPDTCASSVISSPKLQVVTESSSDSSSSIRFSVVADKEMLASSLHQNDQRPNNHLKLFCIESIAPGVDVKRFRTPREVQSLPRLCPAGLPIAMVTMLECGVNMSHILFATILQFFQAAVTLPEQSGMAR